MYANTNEVSNPIRGQLDKHFIGHFGGKDRYLRYDLNAFAEMESRYGSMDAVESLMNGGKMSDIRTFIWVGLLWDNVELDPITGEVVRYLISQYQVGSWITAQNLQSMADSVGIAINNASPAPEQTAEVLQPATPPALAYPIPAPVTEYDPGPSPIEVYSVERTQAPPEVVYPN